MNRKLCYTAALAVFCAILFSACANLSAEETYTIDPDALTTPTQAETQAPSFEIAYSEPEIIGSEEIEQNEAYESFILEMAAQMPASDTIWRDPILNSEDPEYDNDLERTDPLPISQQGKVYANDRVIAIDIPHPNGEETLQFCFGYITGQYNRYLYINPVCMQATDERPIGFYVSVGTTDQENIFLHSATKEIDSPQDHVDYREYGCCNYLIPDHTYDYLAEATYLSPTQPGLCWYVPNQLFEPYGILNIRAVDLMASTTVAIIRLYIAKDEETGTYYLHHAENRNLLQCGPIDGCTQEMIDEALQRTKDLFADGTVFQPTNYSTDTPMYLMEYLDEKYHDYYFDVLHPIYAEGKSSLTLSSTLPLPAIAITFCSGRFASGPDTVYMGVFGTYLQFLANDLKYPYDYEMCIGRFSE